MIKKSPLIRALKAVASEYNDNSHRLNMGTCAMCKEYRHFMGYDCGECPMAHAFKACGRRQCMPVQCISESGQKFRNKDHLNKLEAVKEFFYKTIARVQRMTVAELNAPNAWKFMKKIDISVAEKYGILHDVGPWDE